MFQKKSALELEWEKLKKKEEKFANTRKEQKTHFLNEKLQDKIPSKLQETLNTSFTKAFRTVFEKGTDLIEKTYNKEEIQNTYKINEYSDKIRNNHKSLKVFGKKADSSRRMNLLLSGTTGIGMGLAGVGIPDIPVFTGLILKSIYEIALQYGYEYETEGEKRFILLIIQGAISYDPYFSDIDRQIDDYILSAEIPEAYSEKKQIEETALLLSEELLYMKFIQGIPLVGAVGGAYDVIYLKQITEYANLKYKKRFLMRKRR